MVATSAALATSTTKRVAFLDVLRAVAILLVLAHHFRHLHGTPGWFKWFALRGYIGVDVFFVLSGWLIAGQLLREVRRTDSIDIKRFWIRRWLRTLPVYYVMLLVAFLLTPKRGATDFVPLVFFLQNYVAPKVWLVSWSLCVEEHFYLGLPLLVWVVYRYARHVKYLPGLLVGVAIAASPVWRWLARDPTLSYGQFLGQFYVLTHLRLDGLFIGVTCAALHAWSVPVWVRLQRHPRTVAAVGAAVTVSAGWNPYWVGFTHAGMERLELFNSVFQFTLVSVGVALMICGGVARHHQGVAWGFPGARWVAEHAYALYLSHQFALRLIPREWPFAVSLAAACGLAACFAVILRRAVELPGLALRERVERAR